MNSVKDPAPPLRGVASKRWGILHNNYMGIRVPFAEGEWYHCYSRGIDKRITFQDTHDYYRFKELLYLANSSRPLHRQTLSKHLSHEEIFYLDRDDLLVSIGAYALMPNHFHLLLFEIRDRGISTFMQKIGTAYTMYFNTKYERSGGLFTKPFRSRHVDNDVYFQHVVGYIHSNPADLFEPHWKIGKIGSTRNLGHKLIDYQYSSLALFAGKNRYDAAIINPDVFDAYTNPPISRLIADAQSYRKTFEATPRRKRVGRRSGMTAGIK